MPKRIVVPLSRAGFREAAEWVEEYASKLPKKAEEVVDSMLSKGEAYAFFTLGHIDTGETLFSIVGHRNGNKGVLVVGGNAVWIEFGTGVYAEGQTDHPLLGQIQGIVPHGMYSTTGRTPSQGANPNGWWYMGDDGKVHHTYGIPSNRFFYNTAQMLRRQYPEIAKEIFADE